MLEPAKVKSVCPLEQGNWPGGLCHQCGENFDLGDWYEDQADLITETQPQT